MRYLNQCPIAVIQAVDSAADSRYVYPQLRFLAQSGVQVVLAVGRGIASARHEGEEMVSTREPCELFRG